MLFFAVVNSAFAETCWQTAAERYGVHTNIPHSIARTESAMDAQAVNRNINGTVNVGLVQINSRWFPKLAEMGIQPEDLWDGCTNMWVPGFWRVTSAASVTTGEPSALIMPGRLCHPKVN